MMPSAVSMVGLPAPPGGFGHRMQHGARLGNRANARIPTLSHAAKPGVARKRRAGLHSGRRSVGRHDRGGTEMSNFWSTVWLFFWCFAFVAYLFALFAIIGDLFRDHKLNGWWKAVWIIFLIFVPFLTALIYLIARGRGMAERSARDAQAAQDAADAYIRQTAGAAS